MGINPKFFGAVFLVIPVLLSACIFYPRFEPKTEEQVRCQFKTRSWTMAAGVDVAGSADELIKACVISGGVSCVLTVALIPAIAVGSAAVSGSIVILGNTVHWLEKQGGCSPEQIEQAKQDMLQESLEAGAVQVIPESELYPQILDSVQ